jgi:two-component system cell cycle sensor histidine kinase/response regulator CckA
MMRHSGDSGKRARASLGQAQDLYSLLFEGAPVMYVITHNRTGAPIIADCNRLFLEKLGYVRDQVVGRPLADFYSPESRTRLLQGGYQRALQGLFAAEERTLVTSTGRSVETLLYAVPRADSAGCLSGTLAMYVDITDRKRAEEALRRSEAYNRVLLKAIPDMMFRHARDGTLLDFKEAKELAPLVPPSEFLGKKLTEVLPGHVAEQAIRATEQALASGETQVFEYQLPREGLTAYYEARLVPAEEDEVLSIVRDITSRKQAEKALEAKTEQLLAIAGVMTTFLDTGDWRQASGLLLREALRQTESEYGFTGVVVEGPALRVLAHEGITWDASVNHAFYEGALRKYQEDGYLEFTNFDNLFGQVITTSRAVVCNEPAADARSRGVPAGHPTLRHFLGVPILRGTEVVGMIAVANRPGGYSTIEQNQVEVLAQMAGVFFDTYRRQQRQDALEEQLRLSQKLEAVGLLAGGIAHDFNNLLVGILGYSELVLGELDLDDPRRSHIEEVTKAGRRAAALIRQLLAFSRKQRLTPTVVNLNLVVADIEKMLRRVIREDIDLITALDPKLGKVKADVGQMEQVIMNLAVNARDAMPEGGKLVIGTKNADLDGAYVRRYPPMVAGSYVMLSVTDTGVGMDPETRSRIFEPFFSTKEKDKGTGLGLATVYGIVKQSGGYIWVSSEPGQGTTFRIYLPRIDGNADEPTESDTPSRSTSGSETILLVEDEDFVRQLARKCLERNGYTVFEAAGGAEALRICQEHPGPIQLMLTDLVMPQMSGRELAERVLLLRPATRVLYMSGHSDDQPPLSEPGTAFLEKPFTTLELSRRVRELLDAVEEDEA